MNDGHLRNSEALYYVMCIILSMFKLFNVTVNSWWERQESRV